MDAIITARPRPAPAHKPVAATRTQIRGSSLLLGGRIIAAGLNFVAQVLIVRHLSQADYGAWTYALSIVAFFSGVSTLGLRRGITRFVPIYHEHEEYHKIFGSIALTLLTIAATSAIVVGATYLHPEMLSAIAKDPNQILSVVYILIFMVPVEALDGLLLAMFASFASPRAIFFRKHILGPILKVVLVALLIAFDSDVVFLAYGWLAINGLGICLYIALLIGMMRKRGLFQHFDARALRLPAKEIFAFTIPLMTSDLVSIVMHSMDTLILGYFHDVTEVARYRVVLPAAQLNNLVMLSFGLLYTPLGARLFAKKDAEGINYLYRKTAIWMTILSFPVFALTFSLAPTLTALVYGSRYASSWSLLALTSIGYYFSTVLGFNGLTLQVLGHVRYIVMINIVAAIVNAVLVLLLIPRYGALGAALGTMAAMVVHNILKQFGLRRAAGAHLFEWRYLPLYLTIAAGSIGLLAIQHWLDIGLYVSLLAFAAVCGSVLFVCRHALDIGETFPEVLTLPLASRLFSRSRDDR